MPAIGAFLPAVQSSSSTTTPQNTYEETIRLNSQFAAATTATVNRIATNGGPGAATGTDGSQFTISSADFASIQAIYVVPSIGNSNGSQLWYQGLNYTTGVNEFGVEGPTPQLGSLDGDTFTQDITWQAGFGLTGTGTAAEAITVTLNAAALTHIDGNNSVTVDTDGNWFFYPNAPQVDDPTASLIEVRSNGVVVTTFTVQHCAVEIQLRRTF